MLGTLYGIGVGPGDPELLTLKAVKVLKEVERVFAASSSSNDYSLAHQIVQDHLPPGVPVDQLSFPMTYDPEHLEDAWQANCELIVTMLEEGRNVAFITLGDPLTFSTFIYIMRKVQKRLPDANIRVVPGITSFQAAAACASLPLAEGEETVAILSGAQGGSRLKKAMEIADNVVLMKTYKRFAQILASIKEEGLEDRCCFVSRCGLDGEVVERDFERLARMDRPNYLSLMIIKKNGIK